jgi:hypothetical protein
MSIQIYSATMLHYKLYQQGSHSAPALLSILLSSHHYPHHMPRIQQGHPPFVSKKTHGRRRGCVPLPVAANPTGRDILSPVTSKRGWWWKQLPPSNTSAYAHIRWRWMEVVVKTTTSLENEPIRLVFDGGGWRWWWKQPPPSKTSAYGSYSKEVDGGGGENSHLPRKRARTARTRRKWVVKKITSFENEPVWLGFEGGGWWWWNNHFHRKRACTLVFVGGGW